MEGSVTHLRTPLSHKLEQAALTADRMRELAIQLYRDTFDVPADTGMRIGKELISAHEMAGFTRDYFKKAAQIAATDETADTGKEETCA